MLGVRVAWCAAQDVCIVREAGTTQRMVRIVVFLVVAGLFAAPGGALAQNGNQDRGNASRADGDNNGFPDAGVVVTGGFTSMYAEDGSGAFYWDQGQGRVVSSPGIGSVDDLDQETLTICDYQVHYRGDFLNNAYQDTGWISNNIRCRGYDGNSTYNYLIVHESDPRYTGTGTPEWGGTWEYHVQTESGVGNLEAPRLNPETHLGN